VGAPFERLSGGNSALLGAAFADQRSKRDRVDYPLIAEDAADRIECEPEEYLDRR